MSRIRVGFSWSDSSRRSSTKGSFLAFICAATCSRTRLPEVWWGSAVMTTLPFSFSQRARRRTLPAPVSYMAKSSSRGVMISASVGKSGAGMCSHKSLTALFGASSNRTQARATSRRLWGGMSVAMPTAMPVAPFNNTLGRRAGNNSGSFRVPSKLGAQLTVPWASSANRVWA